MKKPSILIVMKDVMKAGMIRYQLSEHDFSSVNVLPSARECFYLLEKGRIPEYIIYDYSEQPVSITDFLESVHSMDRSLPVICLVSPDDEIIAGELMGKGATDIIMKTGHHQIWMKELVSNLKFLEKKNSH